MVMGAKAPRLLLLCCLGLVIQAPPSLGQTPSKKISFPAGRIESASGEYWAEFITVKSHGDGSGEYRLVVRDKKNRKTATYDFDRSADAEWSKLSDSLVVNDYAGSSMFDCAVLADPAHEHQFQSLFKLLPKAGLPGWNPADMAGHIYLTCQTWISPAALAVKVSGYDDTGRGFDHDLVYDLRGRALHSR